MKTSTQLKALIRNLSREKSIGSLGTDRFAGDVGSLGTEVL